MNFERVGFGIFDHDNIKKVNTSKYAKNYSKYLNKNKRVMPGISWEKKGSSGSQREAFSGSQYSYHPFNFKK